MIIFWSVMIASPIVGAAFELKYNIERTDKKLKHKV